jgi:hypothetical protein
MRRGVSSLLLLPIVAGCGADNGAPAADTPFSARFVEHTTFDDGRVETTRGAFNWDAMRGWAEEERTPGGVTQTVQTGNDCFERVGGGAWKKSQASDPEGTCSAALFLSPKSEFKLMQDVAGLKSVGKAEIHGTQTTHYQGVLSIAAVQGTIELWVDDAGVVRRNRQVGEGDSFTETRDYYDFGAEVTVTTPKLSS